MFQIKRLRLPHEGVIPGARGHKKITVPEGTEVHVIAAGSRYFWCAYLNEATATLVAKSLEEGTKETAKRRIPYDTLLAWNFKGTIPARIHREKVS